MPIKNYTTIIPSNRSIEQIQSALVKHGATGILYEYEQGTGRIAALRFKLPVRGRDVTFSLPVNWRRFQVVLERQRVGKWRDEDYAYKVAWRNIRDWVLAQLALYETQIVELPQVFLPFAMKADGRTLYDEVKEGRFLLGEPKKEEDK